MTLHEQGIISRALYQYQLNEKDAARVYRNNHDSSAAEGAEQRAKEAYDLYLLVCNNQV